MPATTPKKGRPTPKRKDARTPPEIILTVPRVPKAWEARIKAEDVKTGSERIAAKINYATQENARIAKVLAWQREHPREAFPHDPETPDADE